MNSDPITRLNAALEGRYRIVRELGEGGMATVYLAEDLKHKRNVALKVLKPELAATVGPERFLQEVRVTANLQHPHILPLFDSGQADGFLFYVMPYLSGESLRERLQREGELPVGEAVRILREITDALAGAHEMGVVHRDIKPDNVMLTGRHAVVTDFGVAKAVSEATGRHQLTTVGVALGTPAYMAPEQAAADDNIDHRADIYAVGALGYELLAGRAPFSGRTPQQVLAAHVAETPQNITEHRASIPEGLGDVVMKCLEKKPADRWQTAEVLLGQLEMYSGSSGGITPTYTVPLKARRPLPRWAPVAIVGGLAALGGWWWMGREAGIDSVPAGDDSATEFIVAPFVNQSGVDSLDAFGAILADYLTSQISRNDIASIVPNSTVRGLAASLPPGADAAQHYSSGGQARYVIAGTYFQQGGSLVVQAEVTDGPQAELVTSVGPIEGPMTDFMETARASTEQLLGVVAGIVDRGAERARLTGAPRSYAAYRDFVAGMDRRYQADHPAALELFYRAIEADSTYAQALLWAAVSEWNNDFDIRTADSLIQLAERYRSDFLPLDLATLGWLRGWIRGDKEAAFRGAAQMAANGGSAITLCRDARYANRLRLAVEECMSRYDSGYVRQPAAMDVFWQDLLQALHLLGEHDVELERARVARSFHPDDGRAVTREIRALAALGRLEEIDDLMDLAEARRAEESWDFGLISRTAAEDLAAHGHAEAAVDVAARGIASYEAPGASDVNLGVLLYLSGDDEASRATLEALADEAPENPFVLGSLGAVVARMGDRDAAMDLSTRLQEIEETPYVFGQGAFRRAVIAAELGERDEAVRFLNEAYQQGFGYHTVYRHVAALASLAGYPPYERFMEPKG